MNILSWRLPAFGQKPGFYEIFRDSLTNQIGIVPGNGPLTFKDPNRKKHAIYTYYIIAVSPSGFRSAPEIVTIHP